VDSGGRVGGEGWRVGKDGSSRSAGAGTWECVGVGGAARLARGVWVLDG